MGWAVGNAPGTWGLGCIVINCDSGWIDVIHTLSLSHTQQKFLPP